MTRLSRRTAKTRLSPKAARHRRRQGIANIRSGGLSPRKHSSDGATAHIRLTGLLLIYRPRKDERLSWPSWLTCSGRFTHTVVTRRLQAERRTGSVRRPKTGVLPTVLRNQPTYKTVGSRHKRTNIHESNTPRPNGTNRR